ncbi:SDR family NAD(P)-dependent oxidoreductase [Profundibacterium mesophilum]|uniref:3-oxoacyl-acyl-carrier protein reductase n=1 Tax=Profundibacterium mesophilum KAUST100406-0324 TaxID=1037889 RepID=A0A921TEL6_9RHOB|nr:SDR family oxidoreductase [Profundibacterium mesophilum]KAF0677431.1 3-oxoacyl-acyl-carrier protein reductase [Profundibacterium mesophilum KAUST100406-0324]
MLQHTLITGASEGIGKALARHAAERGRNLILSARSEEKLEALAEDLRRTYGRDVVIIPADLSKDGEAERLWKEASQGRRIDILVNNAGIGRNGPFEDLEGWERERDTIEINMTSLTRLMKLALPGMLETGAGRILNIASMAGMMPGPNMAVYHASKAYVISLSRGVAEEVRERGVTVTAFCPGATRSKFFESADMQSTRLASSTNLPDAQEVAEAGWAAMMEGRQVSVPGAANKLAALGAKLLPHAALSPVVRRVMSRQK